MNDYAQPETQRTQSNTAGLVGFIISLVSLVGCGGLLSPISLIFSIVGLNKQPKGFAIAGLILSLIGLSGCILGLLLFGLTLPLMIVSVVTAGVGIAALAVVMAIGQNAFEIIQDAHEHHDQTGVVPATLDDFNLAADERLDHWGNEFVYVRGANEESFLLISAGPDGVIANSDDLIGEFDFTSGAFSAHVRQNYSGLNATEWPNLPQPSSQTPPPAGDPQLPDAPDQPSEDTP